MKGLDEYRTIINNERKKNGVLIYATGKEFAALSEEEGVIPVTAETPYETLETMDAKLGYFFPVFIINDEYGGRGLNFRAQSNPHGITMLILGTFSDRIARHQTLWRVGRFGDPCTRIRDTNFPEVDAKKEAVRKGKLEGAIAKVMKDKAKMANLGRTPNRSLLEFQDNHRTNQQFLKD